MATRTQLKNQTFGDNDYWKNYHPIGDWNGGR